MQVDKFRNKVETLINSNKCSDDLREYLKGMQSSKFTGTEEDWQLLAEVIRSNDPTYPK